MVTQKEQGSKRGRPRGRTARGVETERRLFASAIELMNEQGFEATTLRQIASRAGVTHALLYRYFPSKPAIVLALYETLSVSLVDSASLGSGKWRARGLAGLRASLDVLRPHRRALRGATSVLVGSSELNLFAPETSDSRARVTRVFLDAVAGATDAPKKSRADALGRLLYLLHLGVVLVWLLDRSESQRATAALLRLLESGLTLASAALKLPGAWRLVERIDAVLSDALYPDPTEA